MSYSHNIPQKATFEINTETNIVHCIGNWTLNGIDRLFEKQLIDMSNSLKTSITFEGSTLETMDTTGAWLLRRTCLALEQQGYQVTLCHFNTECSGLLDLVAHYPPESSTLHKRTLPVLETLGRGTVAFFIQIVNFLAFIGEITLVFTHTLWNPSRLRGRAVLNNLQSAGLNALPIVGLMAFLMGVVLAYQGGTQLRQYGANIFIVDLVGITLLRELAPLLTAILIAGRSGSAFTAQIGTMFVTEEVDALRTLGIAPMELLVLPKVLALIIALPLLSAFADVLGLLGGMFVAQLSLEVSITEFLNRLPEAVSLSHYLVGIGKAPVFAAIIASVGCYQGFQVQGTADSVGKQVTVSVVRAIFLVIIADAIFSIVFNWVGI